MNLSLRPSIYLCLVLLFGGDASSLHPTHVPLALPFPLPYCSGTNLSFSSPSLFYLLQSSDPNSFPTTSSPPPANSHWSSSSSSADAAAHLRRLSSLHFEHVHGHVDGTTAAISSSSSSFSHSSAVNTGYPSSVHWPAYDTTQKKYLEFGKSHR